MKILFICGCLEPGKDGVGDYSRLLGAELIRKNHHVMLLSLRDSYVTPVTNSSQENGDSRLQVHRISANYSRAERGSLARQCINRFDPKWISLQYVPYSFHDKGMDLRLPQFFSGLKGDYNWHLMVHEPWVVSEEFFSKGTIVGFVQKQLLKLLTKKLCPAIVHTSNPYYQHLLMQGGLRSELLHLPGNIPKEYGASEMLKKEFSNLGITEATRKQWLLLGIFGSMRPGVSYKDLLETLLKGQKTTGKKVAFLSIGNAGPFVDRLFEEIKREMQKRVLLHKFGPKEVAEISAFFQWLDYGVASVPKHLLGKSGAYAAMRNHGLRILVPKLSKGCREPYFYDYLLKIPDKDFSSHRVAQNFLHALTNTAINTKQMQHEDFVYNT